jgi:hypothetical protein
MVVGEQAGMVTRRLHRLLVGMAGGRRRGVIEQGLSYYKIVLQFVGLDEVMDTLIF